MAWTTPPTWVVGEDITAADLQILSDNGNPTFASYTPSWTATTANPAIGNGTIAGGYWQAGKLVHFRASITMGTTTTYGTGTWQLTLPVTPKSNGRLPAVGTFADISAGSIYDARLYWTSTTTAVFAYLGASGLYTAVTSTAPFTWASTDVVAIEGWYEAA